MIVGDVEFLINILTQGLRFLQLQQTLKIDYFSPIRLNVHWWNGV